MTLDREKQQSRTKRQASISIDRLLIEIPLSVVTSSAMSLHSIPNEIHMNEEQMRRMSVNNPNITAISQDAAKAAESEQTQTLWEGLKLYRKAAGWSVLLSTAIISTYRCYLCSSICFASYVPKCQ